MGAPARVILLLIATLLLAPACSGASSPSVDVAGSTPITFTTDDGVELAGRLFGPEDARAGVVLAHMLPADQRSWYPFAERLALQGYRVLTFDFRGYCPGGDGGCSKATSRSTRRRSDLRAAVGRLRDEGVQQVGIAGASMGGTAALMVAADDPGIGAIATLSAPTALSGLAAGPDVLTRIAGPSCTSPGWAIRPAPPGPPTRSRRRALSPSARRS